VPIENERDRRMRSDQQRVVEEIRRLFDRYRETARHATEDAERARRTESQDEPRVVTLR
jgi:hypothetical protein